MIPLRREVLPPSWSSERRAGNLIPLVVAILALGMVLGDFLIVFGVVCAAVLMGGRT